MTHVFRATDLVNQWAPDLEPVDSEHYPFKVRCLVVSARPARHESFEYFLTLGAGMIDDILYGGDLDGGHLLFFMPERHMSVQEQHRFMTVLGKHKDADKITVVDVITSSPLVLGGFGKGVQIVRFEDDDKYRGAGE